MRFEKKIAAIIDRLAETMAGLRFDLPTEYVYNPIVYARDAHLAYWCRYGRPPKEVLLLGMNPGPWGMVQTGVPFGDVQMVKSWLGIQQPIEKPEKQHPKRPIMGFECHRGEVSGRRLWGWAQQRFGAPEQFFDRFGVVNYCPLVFMEASGRNRTPDKLPKREKVPLFQACDVALEQIVRLLRPKMVIGVGKFAAERAGEALGDMPVTIGQIAHPSPANPQANAGWGALIEKQLLQLGVELD